MLCARLGPLGRWDAARERGELQVSPERGRAWDGVGSPEAFRLSASEEANPSRTARTTQTTPRLLTMRLQQ